ncbi:class I SAM-dependent methyltransferase [Thermogemmatispora sp.]|uniref:class I SAM-dependent methyltransferase n=1 Tax=Thermogemmatispora sp. TaxID=1968838 RepID=UPI0035E43B40
MQQHPQGRGPEERWSAATAYEPYVGRWSRLVAQEFVGWLGQPRGLRWLDVGCGTGALSAAVLALAAPAALLGIDRSADYVAFARAQLADPRVSFVVADALQLPVADSSYDLAVSGLVLNFVSQPAQMLAEMRRAVVPGGTVALYVWDYAQGMGLMRAFWDAATALDPEAANLDEGRRFPLCQPQPLERLFASAGLEAVTLRPIEIETRFRDFEDYWSPFLGGQGPAPGYAMSLPAERRAALRERLRATLPSAADGSITLTARAWAVRGSRPASAT